jgi:lipopolysaccharide transport system ATP-binding protein
MTADQAANRGGSRYEAARPPAASPAVSASGLRVRYCKSLHGSLWYGLCDAAADILGRAPSPGLRPGEFWALDGVSLSLKPGECLGVIGPNGAGKTTLLKTLCGLFPPDEGRVDVPGRAVSLISLGAGFSRTLTGRENVRVNASLMGLGAREIEERFDRIVDFAEAGDFIDAPLSSFSAGMAMRLAFSVAAHSEPDLLLIDEVLAVGDAGFRAKCHAVLERLMGRAAVVFVSHSMAQVARLCTSVMVLRRGRPVYHGPDVAQGIEEYYALCAPPVTADAPGTPGRIVSASALAENQGPDGRLSLEASIALDLPAAVASPKPTLLIHDREGQVLAQCALQASSQGPLPPGLSRLEIGIPHLPLTPGIYGLSFMLFNAATSELIASRRNMAEVRVRADGAGLTPIRLDGLWRIAG